MELLLSEDWRVQSWIERLVWVQNSRLEELDGSQLNHTHWGMQKRQGIDMRREGVAETTHVWRYLFLNCSI